MHLICSTTIDLFNLLIIVADVAHAHVSCRYPIEFEDLSSAIYSMYGRLQAGLWGYLLLTFRHALVIVLPLLKMNRPCRGEGDEEEEQYMDMHYVWARWAGGGCLQGFWWKVTDPYQVRVRGVGGVSVGFWLVIWSKESGSGSCISWGIGLLTFQKDVYILLVHVRTRTGRPEKWPYIPGIFPDIQIIK